MVRYFANSRRETQWVERVSEMGSACLQSANPTVLLAIRFVSALVVTGLFQAPASANTAENNGDESTGADSDAPDFVPEAEPETRAVERFRVPIASDRVYVESPKDAGPARVWIVSFVDLTCAPCRAHVAQLLALNARHKSRWPVEVQFRQLPLGTSPASRQIANAIVIARRLGFGREFLSRIVAIGDLDAAGAQRLLSADGSRNALFQKLLVRSEVDADIAVAKMFGVSTAPTFFVNGRRFSGFQSDEVLDTIVLNEIGSAMRTAAQRKTASDIYAVVTESAKTQANGPARRRFDDAKPGELRPGSSPTRGAAGAPITLTVFSDLYCSHGATHASALKQLLEEYGGKIRVVFKHRPLPIFPASRTAACATIAAQEQAKFWEMHDKIVGGLAPGHARDDGEAVAEQKLPKRLVAYASEIKLDTDAFRLVMDGERCQKEIDDDLALAAKLGVTGVPTTFVNGRRVIGAASASVFRSLIEDELRKVKK
ncbi:MAG: thioredoxin domain-containing protein [Deltaproteobacteria bacterium]|nr:thioredoxin domain-containing protein [Deltaproteobacteria bacterium]